MSAWNRFSFRKLGLGLASLTLATVAANANATNTCLSAQDITVPVGSTISLSLDNEFMPGFPGTSTWAYSAISLGAATSVEVELTFHYSDGTYESNFSHPWLGGGAGITSTAANSGTNLSWNSATPPTRALSKIELQAYDYSASGISSVQLTQFGITTSAMTCTTPASGGSGGGSSAGSASTASAMAIQSDVARVTRSAVTANNSMMSQGLERFIGDRNSGMSLGDAISTSGLNSVVVSPEMQAYGETLFGGGSFFGQSVSADGTYRKVTFGEFDVQHERGAGTTLSFNGRMAWERAAGEDAMVAYFLGAEVNRSNIEGSYTGDQNRYGITGGMYGFKELDDKLYLSGYGSLGVARSSLDITDGASSNVTGDYTSRTMSLGGQVSGSVEYETYELRPSVSLNYVKTWVGDITLDDSGTPTAVAVGDTTFAELIASPEFLFPMEQQEGSNMVTVASAAPRLICERSDAANTVTKECGAGLELGINGTSEDGATNLNASIRFDRVGGVDRQGLNLQAEFRF